MFTFAKHGIYSIQVENGVLLVDATGPFNEELIYDYRAALESAITKLEGEPWGQIIVLRELSLFTPDAEQSLIASVHARKARGLTVSAVVCESPYYSVKSQISHVYDMAKVQHAFFATTDQARAWLFDALKKDSQHPLYQAD